MNIPNPRNSSQQSSKRPAGDSSQPPCFWPAEFDYQSLSPEQKQAVNRLIMPAYNELVERAPTAMERCAGSSFIFLLLLELLDQFDMRSHLARQRGKANASPNEQADENVSSPREELKHFLQLMDAKEKAGKFLLHVAKFRQKHRYFIGDDSLLDDPF